MLSLLVIYSGVGASLCSCLTCEVECMVCSTPCSGCGHDVNKPQLSSTNIDAMHKEFNTDITCQDKGCTVNIYKVNLAQQSAQESISVPNFELFCELLPDLWAALFIDDVVVVPTVSPPLLESSRLYLALYSVLVI